MMTEKTKKNLKKIIKIVLLVFVGAVLLVPVVNLCLAYFKPLSSTPVLRIAHRGGAKLAPENTLAAMDSGFAHHADFLETDVRQSRDGQLLLMHDISVDRTTNGKGIVHRMTYEEIRSLNASNSLRSYHHATGVPLLHELLARVDSSSVKLLIEIKDPNLYPDMVPALARLIKDAKAIHRVAIFSFDGPVLSKVRSALPGVETGIFCIGPESVPDSVTYIAPNWISILYFPFLVRKFHQKGAKVLAWTPDGVSCMKYLCKWGVDGIITDRPDLLDALANDRLNNQ